MATLRVIITAPDADVATEVKEKFFKKLYEHSGPKVTFEVPEGADDDAQQIIAFAKNLGCEGETEVYNDPLDDAGGVDFW